jgi:hypothetical protein
MRALVPSGRSVVTSTISSCNTQHTAQHGAGQAAGGGLVNGVLHKAHTTWWASMAQSTFAAGRSTGCRKCLHTKSARCHCALKLLLHLGPLLHLNDCLPLNSTSPQDSRTCSSPRSSSRCFCCSCCCCCCVLLQAQHAISGSSTQRVRGRNGGGWGAVGWMGSAAAQLVTSNMLMPQEHAP